MSSSVGMMTFPTEWKVKQIMFQTTNQVDISLYIIIYHYISLYIIIYHSLYIIIYHYMYIYIYLYLLWFINQLSTVFGHHLVVVCATQQWPSQRQNETRGRNKLAPPVSFILGHLAVHLTIENRLNRSENRKKKHFPVQSIVAWGAFSTKINQPVGKGLPWCVNASRKLFVPPDIFAAWTYVGKCQSACQYINIIIFVRTSLSRSGSHMKTFDKKNLDWNAWIYPIHTMWPPPSYKLVYKPQ